MVVQLIIDRLECGTNISEVHDPAGIIRYWASHADVNAEGVPMETAALMPLWHIWQAVCGFASEYFEYVQPSLLRHRKSQYSSRHLRGWMWAERYSC